ncbi:MAG: hypothetical protein KatS3mg026_0915 [Bacteroidia bacterium]|nr:MAG: hypothetical protein KatS3mg026_0915 [Bacteroidia bacterium]
MRQDALAYAFTTLLNRAQPFFEALILTALLPVEAFGAWSWAGALYLGVAALTHGGLPAAVLRYASAHPSEGAALLRYAMRQALPWVGLSGLLLGAVAWTVPMPVRLLAWCHVPALAAFLPAEILRAYLRGRYENRRLAGWQLATTLTGLALLSGAAAWKGVWGAAFVRLLQPVWLLGLGIPLLRPAWDAPARAFPGLSRFGWHALWGNLALEAIFLLPTWLVGWRSGDSTLVAYWRWATLLPLNLRQLFTQAVMYSYPRWVQARLPLLLLYRRWRFGLWALAGVVLGSAALWLLIWDWYPGPAYAPARPYYALALLVAWLWSTDALLLPNLLSAKGHIRAYSRSYAVGLLAALPLYGMAGRTLELYLVGLAAAALAAALTAYTALKNQPVF